MKNRKKVKTVKQTTKADVTKPPVTASAGTTPAAQTAAPVVSRPSKIKVLKPETKYRGAREAWFARLKEFDGKTEGEFLADTKERPPALTRNQTAEQPSGWMRFFTRSGVATLQQS